MPTYKSYVDIYPLFRKHTTTALNVQERSFEPSVSIVNSFGTFFLSVHKLSALLKLSGISQKIQNVLTTTRTRCRRCKEINFHVQILLSIKILMRTKLPIQKAPNQAEASRTTIRGHEEHAEALPNIKSFVRMLSAYCPGPSGCLVMITR